MSSARHPFFVRKKSKTSSDTFWNISLSFFGEVYYNNSKADEDIASDITLWLSDAASDIMLWLSDAASGITLRQKDAMSLIMIRGQDKMGRRQEKRKKKQQMHRKWGLLGVSAAAVLCAAYLLTCSMVDGKTIVDGVAVNGTEVGGLTAEQAADRIRTSFEEEYAGAVLTVNANGAEYQVEMYPSIAMDVDSAAKKAMEYGHGSFLTRGAALLKAKLFGEDLTQNPQVADEGKLGEAIDASGLSAINTTVQTTYEVTGESLVFHKGVTGVSVDKEKLTEEVKEAVSKDDFETVIESPMLTGTVEATDVQAVYDKIHTKKANATLDPKNDYKIVKSVTGVSFDVDSARAAFDAAAEGEDVTIPLKIKKPKITTKKLKKHLFKDKLGSCTTNVSGSSARVSNVDLAAETIDGTILLPGETFSYNDTLGERTTARGYQAAPAYSNGESVQEVGGGICQVSSTLYKATLLSNLEIVEHHNHSYVSAYIGIGMDATVSWGGPDYQFKNDTDYPIRIDAAYSGGQVTCTIYGAKLDDVRVEMTAETLQVNSCGTVYQDDPDMAEGTSTVVSSGHDGYVVQTYRNLYEGDKKISSKKEAYCVYRKKDRIVRVGTKAAEPAPDTTAEGETGETGGSELTPDDTDLAE